jgi:NAD(P)-dependent dehydrogenase (short-subunit alcohol dehydrogenase family)
VDEQGEHREQTERHVAVVTGGARGIGAAISRTLSDVGYAVALFDVDEPAAKETVSHRPFLGDRIMDSIIKATPLRRLAKPEDIAEAVAFFASPNTTFITGQVLSVSGGLSMSG